MTRSGYRRLAIAMVMLGLLAPLAAGASERRKSLDDAVWDARREGDGRVISAETRRRDGRETHDVRILTPEGRVKRYRYDAESGRREKRRR